MIDEEISRLHAIVRGRVQGVGFRHFVVQTARNLRLTGWVRNRLNGTVEVVAEGGKQSLNHLLQDLHLGPNASHVTEVEHEFLTGSGEFKRFSARYTA